VSYPTFDARLSTGILRHCPDAVIFAHRERVIGLWNEDVTAPRPRNRELQQRREALQARRPLEVSR
jgi:hypothetical protein